MRGFRGRAASSWRSWGLWIIGLMPHITYLIVNPDHLAEPATTLYLRATGCAVLKYTPPMYLCTFTSPGCCSRGCTAALPLDVSASRSVAAVDGDRRSGSLFFAFAVDRVPYIIIHGIAA